MIAMLFLSNAAVTAATTLAITSPHVKPTIRIAGAAQNSECRIATRRYQPATEKIAKIAVSGRQRNHATTPSTVSTVSRAQRLGSPPALQFVKGLTELHVQRSTVRRAQFGVLFGENGAELTRVIDSFNPVLAAENALHCFIVEVRHVLLRTGLWPVRIRDKFLLQPVQQKRATASQLPRLSAANAVIRHSVPYRVMRVIRWASVPGSCAEGDARGAPSPARARYPMIRSPLGS